MCLHVPSYRVCPGPEGCCWPPPPLHGPDLLPRGQRGLSEASCARIIGAKEKHKTLEPPAPQLLPSYPASGLSLLPRLEKIVAFPRAEVQAVFLSQAPAPWEGSRTCSLPTRGRPGRLCTSSHTVPGSRGPGWGWVPGAASHLRGSTMEQKTTALRSSFHAGFILPHWAAQSFPNRP